MTCSKIIDIDTSRNRYLAKGQREELIEKFSTFYDDFKPAELKHRHTKLKIESNRGNK